MESFLVASIIKSLPVTRETQSSIPGSGRSPGEGNGNSPQYSCLGNPMDGGAWRAMVHRVTVRYNLETEHVCTKGLKNNPRCKQCPSKRSEQTLQQRKCTSGQWAYEKMLDIVSITEMQIKTKRYHFPPTGMATIKKTDNSRYWCGRLTPCSNLTVPYHPQLQCHQNHSTSWIGHRFESF